MSTEQINHDTLVAVPQLGDEGRVFNDPQPQLTCPECGKVCRGATGLGVHRSTIHGVPPKSKSYKKKRLAKPKTTKTKALVPVTQGQLEGLEQPADWTADEIFDSVVSMLYPQGSIPLHALRALMQWRQDTERMLQGAKGP